MLAKVELGIPVDEFLLQSSGTTVLDVRTPAEYAKGHIPGSFNLPLFDNEERARIGTLYHHAGSDAAILLGMEVVGPRMTEYIVKARSLVSEGRALLYCWRGGMRSNSLGWLLNTAGMECRTLTGGYKAYRNHLLQRLSEPRHYQLVGGMTGSGKTDLIRALQLVGEQVIDLEKLASHKGSAFGAVGEREQPSQEQFENELFFHWSGLDPARPIWIEDESIQIGKLFIPRPFFGRMKQSPVFELRTSLENRLNRLVRDYALADPGILKEVFLKLKKRLGHEKSEEAITALQGGHFRDAAAIALQYYDKVYSRQLQEKSKGTVYTFNIEDNDFNDSVLKLIHYSQTFNFQTP